MRTLIPFYVLIICLSSCTNNKATKETDINKINVITAKWNFIESNAQICEDDKSNSPTSGVFIYKGKRYLRKESYTLDKTGKIDSIYAYHNPLGVNIYSMADYGRMMMNLDTVGFNKMKTIQIKWDDSRKIIMDNNESKTPTKVEKDRIIIEDAINLIIYEVEN